MNFGYNRPINNIPISGVPQEYNDRASAQPKEQGFDFGSLLSSGASAAVGPLMGALFSGLIKKPESTSTSTSTGGVLQNQPLDMLKL